MKISVNFLVPDSSESLYSVLRVRFSGYSLNIISLMIFLPHEGSEAKRSESWNSIARVLWRALDRAKERVLIINSPIPSAEMMNSARLIAIALISSIERVVSAVKAKEVRVMRAAHDVHEITADRCVGDAWARHGTAVSLFPQHGSSPGRGACARYRKFYTRRPRVAPYRHLVWRIRL